jgi:hypothetical protein
MEGEAAQPIEQRQENIKRPAVRTLCQSFPGHAN